ncbi:ImmA/IrrE family metallo-endopeptidase [Candidatus Palauibacter sp.]|uniref:ImmA/IrrE family metallo-endopeptidase n=1 Tax=Candidatus Palauibacter sp. TaxID=3101350 RepID=UPI003B023A3C
MSLGSRNLTEPSPLDLTWLVDYGLAAAKIAVYAVPEAELPTAEAETRAGPGGWLDIWLRAAFYDSLFERNHRTLRARSTLAHEIGHAVLHPREVKLGQEAPEALSLQRAARQSLPAFRDSEWQAHTFAAAILVPLTTLRTLDGRDPSRLADVYDVSVPLVASHLRRCRELLPSQGP